MKWSKLWLLLVLLMAAREACSRQAMQSWHEGASKLWLSRDGSTLVSFSEYGKAAHHVRVWSVAGRRLIDDVPLAPEQRVSVLAVSNDGRRFIVGRAPYNSDSGGETPRCEVWDVTSGGVKPAWQATNRLCSAAAFAGRNVVLLLPTRIETRDAEGRVLGSVPLKRKPAGLYEVVNEVGALSPDGQLAALGGSILNWGVTIFDARTGQPQRVLRWSESGEAAILRLTALHFSPDASSIVIESEYYQDIGLVEGPLPLVRLYRVWDAASGKILMYREYRDWKPVYLFPVFSPDNHAILSAKVVWPAGAEIGRALLSFLDIRTQKRAAFQIPRPWGEKDGRWLREVRLSGDGRLVAALDGKGNIWVQTR